MHPEQLGFEECDLNHIFKVEDKETQTSNISITDNCKNCPKLPLPREIVKSDKGSVSVYEFCQHGSERPKSIAIVKETLREEIVNHPKELSTENTVSNKYRYCKEVIKPYLKSYLQECPDSEEQLISEIIPSADQEYPDYQPCFEVFEGSKDIEEKTIYSNKSSASKIDAATSHNLDMGSKQCLPKVDTSSTVLENEKSDAKDESSSSSVQYSDTDKSGKPQSKPTDSTTSVKSKLINKPIEQPPSLPKEEKPIPKPDCSPPPVTYKESKLLEKESNKSKSSISEYFGVNDPTIYDKASDGGKDPSKTEAVNIDVKVKEMVAAHRETLGTIKIAMEDFISKVYKTTQDTVTVVKTESAKHLETFRQSKSNNTENAQPKSSRESKTEEAITSFNFLRKIESKDKKDDSTDDQATINPGELLERIVGKVDSTISVISDKITFDNFTEMLKPGKFKDPSSPYDVPTPPKEISNIIINEPVPTSNSVFVTIKNRIYSMFSENDDKPKDVPDSSNSSNAPTPPKKGNSDEDLINRLIE